MNSGGFSDLDRFLSENNFDPNGCFIDTSILFAATYPLDRNNEDAEIAFNALLKANLSIYTNVNVKYEFLDLHRRALLMDSLCDFYDLYSNRLPDIVRAKLKSHKTIHKNKIDSDKSSKIEVDQQKNFIRLLRPVILENRDAWEILCHDFLLPQLQPIWENARLQLKIEEIKIRKDDSPQLLNSTPAWEDVVRIMGNRGIASSDAMILNIFNCSKLPLLLTADLEMARCVLSEKRFNKSVFVPDSDSVFLTRI